MLGVKSLLVCLFRVLCFSQVIEEQVIVGQIFTTSTLSLGPGELRSSRRDSVVGPDRE